MTVPHIEADAQPPGAPGPSEYPDLFRTLDWKVVIADFEFGDRLPPDDMIANVNIVPRVGDDWLMIRFESGVWWVPGGTREPGESLDETMRRELLEEAGAELLDMRYIGAWRCRSTQPAPHRPHVPHPIFFRAVALGEVRVVGEPAVPPGGELISEVAVVPLEEAVERFRGTGRADLADLYRLAARISGDGAH